MDIGLTKKQISVLAETHRHNYAVEITRNSEGLWKVGIDVLQPKRHLDVFTSRGELKTWRDLGDAILFVQQTCLNCSDVIIVANAWKFSLVQGLPNSPE